MGSFPSILMGLGIHEEEEVVGVLRNEEGSGGEDEQREEKEVIEVVDEKDGGASDAEQQDGGGAEAEAVLQCSICLDVVVAGERERSTARLQCGHEFHLDCVGSAFNSKGTMQCPNCRQVEKGHWLYARGPISSQHVNNDGLMSDEDFVEFEHPEQDSVPLRFEWYPRSRLSDLPFLFDERPPSQPAAFHDVMGQNIHGEPMSVWEPRTSEQAAYIARLRPLLPPISSSLDITERSLGGFSSAHHDYWTPTDFHHHLWPPVSHSYFPLNNNGEIPEVAMRIGGVDSGSQQRGSFHSFYGNGFENNRTPSVPPMEQLMVRAPGNTSEEFQEASQGSGSMETLGVGRSATLLPHITSYFTEPSSPSGRMDYFEYAGGNNFYSWEQALQHDLESLVNNEGVRSSSLQQEPPHGAPESASAAWRLSGDGSGSAS